MIHFVGTSYAAVTLKEAARRRGLKLTDDISKASLIFVSEDTPTDEYGNRDLSIIKEMVVDSLSYNVPVVITSQVEPGFCRQYNGKVYHQAETLRIEDGMQRAMHPEMFIVGSTIGSDIIRPEYDEYLFAFDCPVIHMTYEEAEFSKIAINAFLISQVETTNMLSQAADKCGCDWGKIAHVLRKDSRIGKYAYLSPGDWRNSKHLLRDYVTLQDMEDVNMRSALLASWL